MPSIRLKLAGRIRINSGLYTVVMAGGQMINPR